MELSEIIDYVLRTHNNINPNVLRGIMIRYQASDNVRFIIVDELPEQGEEKVIYLVPAYDPTLGDIYEEYVWIDGAYELLGHERRITIDDALSETSENPVQNRVVTAALNEKQETLVSGTNIKTINNNSILGSGNITINDLPITPTVQDNGKVLGIVNGDWGLITPITATQSGSEVSLV